jgi:hypothetical protein
MRSKIVLAVVLCLVAAAALGIGAPPALAASGCTCHTAVPPTGGAPAAGGFLVAGVTDCTTCHKGMTVPHPELVEPTLTLKTGIGFMGLRPNALVGLFLPFKPLGGVTVYVQGKAADAPGWTDLDQGTTNIDGQAYTGTVPAPVPAGMTFRAISQGRAGPPVVKPAFSVPWAEPPAISAVLRLRGLTNYKLRLGRTVTCKATWTPTDLAGQRTHFRFQRWVHGDEVSGNSWVRTINADGVMTYKFRPRVRGLYSVFVGMGGTAAFQGFQSEPRRFRVK